MPGSGWDAGPGPHNMIYFGRFSEDNGVSEDYELDEVYVWEQGIPESLLHFRFSSILV